MSVHVIVEIVYVSPWDCVRLLCQSMGLCDTSMSVHVSPQQPDGSSPHDVSYSTRNNVVAAVRIVSTKHQLCQSHVDLVETSNLSDSPFESVLVLDTVLCQSMGLCAPLSCQSMFLHSSPKWNVSLHFDVNPKHVSVPLFCIKSTIMPIVAASP